MGDFVRGTNFVMIHQDLESTSESPALALAFAKSCAAASCSSLAEARFGPWLSAAALRACACAVLSGARSMVLLLLRSQDDAHGC